MGKATGFLEFTRELPKKRPVEERLHDFNEFVHLYEEEELNKQAARCMDCGIPFCHNGCPVGNLIPDFNDAIFRRSWKEAYEILSAT
ncbi:MAG TPA: glutamate synthase, partial [Segetibacter sp.]